MKKNLKICIVGPGKRFLSGITYYTIRLSNEFSKDHDTSVVTLRKLLPKFMFPGKRRVGKEISKLDFNNKIKVYDGIDWYWFPSILQAIYFINKEKPEYIILQWWTSSIAHTYLLLKFMNKILFKSKLIIEFHETVDPLEDKIFILKLYLKTINRLLFNNLNCYITHSDFDKRFIEEKYKLASDKVFVVPHGSYEHFVKRRYERRSGKFNILFFGLLRPYKGVEYLIKAFNKISKDKIDNFHLTIIGETWEDYNLPKELINKSRYKSNITFVNRYVTDEEVDSYFSKADVAVFPYVRASQSGAAHVAISYGIPVIVSKVGGLEYSMSNYKGTLFVEPKKVNQISKKIFEARKLRNRRFPNPLPWRKTITTNLKIISK